MRATAHLYGAREGREGQREALRDLVESVGKENNDREESKRVIKGRDYVYYMHLG